MDPEKSLEEQQLESEQRAYELGQRYGYIDARTGRPGLLTTSRQMGLSGREAELYDQGHQEAYDRYMASLSEPGHPVSVPSLVPGERRAAITTGRTWIKDSVLFVEVMVEGGTVGLWLPADVVRVIR